MREKNKVYPYVVVLKQKNRRTVELSGLIMGAIPVLLQFQRLISNPNDWIISTLLAITLGGILLYNIDLYRKRKKMELLALFIVAAAGMGVSIFGFAYLVMAALIPGAIRPIQIGFSETEIVFDTWIKKKVQWTELNNAMIKDGILTLDYKNNKLFQKETDDDDTNDEYDVSEEEFNAFCTVQLARTDQQQLPVG